MLAVAIAAAAGYAAAAQIRSPAEIAARTAAPKPSPLLVPVEERVLSTNVVTRGTARFGSPQQLLLAPSALKPHVGRITQVPLPGSELREGDVVIVASGRPVFLLEGTQPTFRDLGPGVEGEDVLQLERALVRLGIDPGPVDGAYDSGTEAAVADWYERNGYTAIGATEVQLAAISALEVDLTTARLDIFAAEDSIGAAESGLAAARLSYERALNTIEGAPAAIVAAQAEANADNSAATATVASKQAALDLLNATAVVIPATSEQIAAAQAELNAALANEELTVVTTAKAIEDAQLAHDAASTSLAAGLATDEAVRKAFAELDVAAADLAAALASEEPTNRAAGAAVAAKRAALNGLLAGTATTPATKAELALAEADLASARAGAESARLAGLKAIADIAASRANADAELPSLEAAIDMSERALDNAIRVLDARRGLADSTAASLALTRGRAGVQVPADEVIFVPSAPRRVESVLVRRGEEAAGPILRVTDSVVAIDGSLALSVANLVTAGMSVVIDEPDLGIRATGIVSRVAERPGTNGVDGFHVYFEVLVDESPPTIVGASVRLTVPVESTSGRVTTVPVSAISLAVDGSSRVQRESGGTLEFVTVDPGLSAQGFVEIGEGSLSPGDLVVIGFDQRGGSTP